MLKLDEDPGELILMWNSRNRKKGYVQYAIHFLP